MDMNRPRLLSLVLFPVALMVVTGFAGAQPALVSPTPAAEQETPAPAGGISAAEIARRIQVFYDSAKTYKAQFKQRYTIYAYNKTKDSRGEVVFQKPGKMRWTYSNNGNVVVSDGAKLKVYEQENQQMYLQTVDKTQYPAALSFLVGQGRLSESFELQKLDAAKLKFPGGYVLLGTPKSPTPAYQKILFYVDAATFQVRRVLLLDAQKNRNRFDFIQPIVNQPLDARVFAYDPPPGTRIIKP